MTLPTQAARAELRSLIPAVLVLILWVIWIPSGGGFGSDVWYPSALGVASLGVVMFILGRQRMPSTRAARVSLLAFLALVAVNYLSILWAGSPGSALDASNKLVLYAAVAWVISVLPWTARALAALLGLWALGVCAFCAVGLLRATSAASLDPFFVQLRYATPLQYPNATAALAVMGMWPALILSARRELPAWLRAACLSGAVFLAEFALLPQSRGALVGLIVTAPIALAASSDRFRLLCRMAIVGGGLAISIPRTIAVDNAISAAHRAAPVLDRAAEAMLLTSVAALLVGAMLALAESRLGWRLGWLASRASASGRRGPRTSSSWTGHRGMAIAAVLLIAFIGTTIAVAPRVIKAANAVISKGREDAGTGTTRLLSTTPEERLDYARVALHLFSNAPVLGVGAGNFGRRYDGLRRFPKHSQYTHDLALRVLSETGIVGLVLLVAVIGAITVGLWRTARETEGLGRACSVAAFTVAAYFLLHDSLDWLDQFPALAAPALAFPMAAMAQGRGGAQPASVRRDDKPSEPLISERTGDVAFCLGSRRIRRGVASAAVLVVWMALCLALAGPYLATQYTTRAFATFITRPQAAFEDLRRAEALDPLSVDPIISEGTIALYLGEPGRARAAFHRAISLEDDWYPRLELALLDAQAGRFSAASNQLNAAARLDVDDPVIAQATNVVGHRERVDPERFNQILLQGAEADVFGQSNIK